MSDRFHNLVSRSSVCALVLGKGEEVRLFYMHQMGDAALRLAVATGFRHSGLIGLTSKGLEMEQVDFAPRLETARLMRLARSEFLSALAAMSAGLTMQEKSETAI